MGSVCVCVSGGNRGPMCVCVYVCVRVCALAPQRLYSHHKYSIPSVTLHCSEDKALPMRNDKGKKWPRRFSRNGRGAGTHGFFIDRSAGIVYKVSAWQMCVKSAINGEREKCLCSSVEMRLPSAWCEFNWSWIDYLLFVINPKWVYLPWPGPSSVWLSCCPSKPPFLPLFRPLFPPSNSIPLYVLILFHVIWLDLYLWSDVQAPAPCICAACHWHSCHFLLFPCHVCQTASMCCETLPFANSRVSVQTFLCELWCMKLERQREHFNKLSLITHFFFIFVWSSDFFLITDL